MMSEVSPLFCASSVLGKGVFRCEMFSQSAGFITSDLSIRGPALKITDPDSTVLQEERKKLTLSLFCLSASVS